MQRADLVLSIGLSLGRLRKPPFVFASEVVQSPDYPPFAKGEKTGHQPMPDRSHGTYSRSKTKMLLGLF
jgi:hypothetical protein